MIKTQTCVTIHCNGCGEEYMHDYTPHWPQSMVKDARAETSELAEWFSDGADVDLCRICRLHPHPFRLRPNTTDECWRCPNPAEEHEGVGRGGV